jgi:adenine-specific DNA-methyltransferase
MARGRKKQLEIDISKIRDIETYEHKDKKRSNNPPVGMAQYDKAEEVKKTYQFDPHLDPTLQWAGKAEGISFEVPTSSIHIHESIKPHKIIRSVQTIGDDYEDPQMSLFETPVERMRRRRDAIEFYQHGVNWTNRLIAGDSLVIMNSLLEKEGMAGQVQMVYIDPPYGIKYGSNFQPFVDKRDVKDKKDEDLTQEPEMIKAFRDTWELGIHSYLTYLRNRLLLARELLTDSGSIFIQISDDNVHHVRELCDEIFGIENYVSQISFKKTISSSSGQLPMINDFIIWYAKDKCSIKFRRLFRQRTIDELKRAFQYVEHSNGLIEKVNDNALYGSEDIFFNNADLTSQGASTNSNTPYIFEGKPYYPSPGRHWSTTAPEGLKRLEDAGRLFASGNTLCFRRKSTDFPYLQHTSIWDDTLESTFSSQKIYVVQTAAKVISRCMLMTTDPGDLVLDITCGSGTTAYVAEQWGRRWITCDTSRVAIALAKQRLMTATFDYYKLAHPEQGVGSGFIYKTVPHITLKSIANNEPPAQETLYDQPEIDKTKVRITGPFTVEALPAPVVKPLDTVAELDDISAKQADWRNELLATGIRGRNGAKIEFSRVEPLSGTKFLQAEAETKEDTPRKVVICFGSETKPLDSRMVSLALDEAENLRPKVSMIIFAAFQFDPEAAKDIEETSWPGVTLLKVQMNTDLMTDDLKKKRSSNESFWLVGQPDVELLYIEKGKDKGKYKVRVNGFDYYDVKKGTVESGNVNRIAMWMLDTNYDGMCIEPMQVFFPMGGKKDGWNKLAKTLRAEINQDLIEQYAGNESLPFTIDSNRQIAVKIIDDRGIESLKVIKVGDL